MIQVLHRAFQLLETIGDRGEAGLAILARSVGLEKNTTSNILKTLRDLGYLEKDDSGLYRHAAKIAALNRSGSKAPQAFGLMQKTVSELTTATFETTVIAFLHRHRRYQIAKAESSQEIKVNTEITPTEGILRHVTGRLLVAQLPPAEFKAFLKIHGLPSKEDWSQANTLAGLRKELVSIRAAGSARQIRKEIFSFAAPILGQGGEVLAALGLTMPEFRAAEKRESLIGATRSAAEKLSHSLAQVSHRDLAKHFSGEKK